MNYKILLLALVAFSFLLAGCGGKKADETATGEVSAPEAEPGPSTSGEPGADAGKEKLASMFDIEIDEPPSDFEYAKAPGED